jgi:acetoin utilization protein AcuB
MIKGVITLTEGDTLRTAIARLRENRIRQIPVVSGRKLVGIVTDRDLRQASMLDTLLPNMCPEKDTLERLLDNTAVKEIMIRDVITVSPDDIIEDAAKILHDNKIGGLPVVDEGELVGIITVSDILETFLAVMGIGEPSSRLELVLDDVPGILAEVAQIIKEFEVNIISIVTAPWKEKGKRVVILRINTIYPNPVAEALWESGFHASFL